MFIFALVLIALIGTCATGVVVYLFVKFQANWQSERKDLLDRLMARDLPEVKQAQAIENRIDSLKPTSKRQNDMRVMEMAKKAERE
jgi:hypothetical protein